MPRRISIITHRVTWRELDAMNDQRLADLLREQGMDVVFRSGMGCVAAPGSQFSWQDISNCVREFRWVGEIPLTAEEIVAQQALQNLASGGVIPGFKSEPVNSPMSPTSLENKRALRLDD